MKEFGRVFAKEFRKSLRENRQQKRRYYLYQFYGFGVFALGCAVALDGMAIGFWPLTVLGVLVLLAAVAFMVVMPF